MASVKAPKFPLTTGTMLTPRHHVITLYIQRQCHEPVEVKTRIFRSTFSFSRCCAFYSQFPPEGDGSDGLPCAGSEYQCCTKRKFSGWSCLRFGFCFFLFFVCLFRALIGIARATCRTQLQIVIIIITIINLHTFSLVPVISIRILR